MTITIFHIRIFLLTTTHLAASGFIIPTTSPKLCTMRKRFRIFQLVSFYNHIRGLHQCEVVAPYYSSTVQKPVYYKLRTVWNQLLTHLQHIIQVVFVVSTLDNELLGACLHLNVCFLPQAPEKITWVPGVLSSKSLCSMDVGIHIFWPDSDNVSSRIASHCRMPTLVTKRHCTRPGTAPWRIEPPRALSCHHLSSSHPQAPLSVCTSPTPATGRFIYINLSKF